ncbi:MAG: DNA repair protein RecO C-terminal domain-containing protein [Bacteroidales bacterium]|nr:DNA repair protein RecO C-terminal domain-containing protein [Bacteroidales bacterium]
MTHSTLFIILAVTKIGEKSLVLHCLTKEWGRRSFIVSVSRTSGMAFFLPLNILNAEVIENPKSDLWRLHSVTAASPLNGIRSDVRKNSMTMFMSEVLFRTIKDGCNEDGLFDWCSRSVLTLDALENDFSNYHLRFLMELCGALGFLPSSEDLLPFAGKHLAEMEQLLSLDFSHFMLFPLSGSSRNEIAEILLHYLSHHVESRIEVKSLRVLRELFT